MASSSKYWQQRFEAMHDAILKDGTGCYDDAERLFRKASDSIQADIAKWYMRLAENNQMTLAEAQKLLRDDELKEFHWTVEEYIKHGRESGKIPGAWAKELENASAKFHISRLEAIQLQMQQHLEELYGGYTDDLDKAMGDTYRQGYYKTAYNIQTGIHMGFDIGQIPKDQVDTVLKKPWAADGRNFSDRIWTDKAKLLNNLEDILTQGLVRGDPLQKMAKELAHRMDVSLSNAARLITTESAFFASKGEYDCMKELGVKEYEFVATLDRRTSDICKSMDGKVIPMKDFKPGVTAPPLHCYCRSCTVPHVDNEISFHGRRIARDEKGKNYYVPGDMTYQDWKNVFVDKKMTLDAWNAQNAFEFKRRVLQSAVVTATQDYTQAKSDFESIPEKEYTNIWRDPVTPADWEEKKDKIQAKQDYFDNQLQNVTDESTKEKFERLIHDLKEFDQIGSDYAAKKKRLEAAESQLESAKSELEKHLNGGKIKENPYSKERKNKALWFDDKHGGFDAADKYFDPPAVKIHKNATSQEKKGFYTYTEGAGGHNRPLAGFQKPYYDPGAGWEQKYYVGPKKVWIDYEQKGDAIRGLTTLIEKSTYDRDVWLQSGQEFATLEGFLKIPYGTLRTMSDKELQQFVGRKDYIYNFISTAVNEGGGGVFNKKPMKFNIYAPKGSQILYASGNGAFGKAENEMIIQRGAYYKIAKIYWGNDATDGGRRKLFVDLEIRIEKGYDTFQQDPLEWKGSKKDYKS